MPLLPPGVTNEDIQTLNVLVGQIFDSAQRSIATHQKLVIKLSALRDKSNKHGLESIFNKIFVMMINRILPVKKGETCADRIVKFVETFVSRQANDGNEQNTDENEESSIGYFAEFIIQHLRRGITAKDKNVRFRCCQLIAVTINHIGEISDDLFSEISLDLISRLHDKEPSVRLQASLALCRLQGVDEEEDEDEDEIGKTLISSLRTDTSAEVRRAILLNLVKTPKSLPYLLERARDVHPTTRRCVYSRTLKEIGDFRQLSIGMREKILQWGLQDRDSAVRTAATKMFVSNWLETTNNDLVELLERLDVLNSKIAETAMLAFFDSRRDVLDKLQFSDEFWQALSGESVFLARMFNQYCNAHDELKDLADVRMPELTKLAFLTEKYLGLLEKTGNDPELEFIIEQLLTIISTSDFSDEIGRRKNLVMLRNSIVALDLNESLINLSMEIIYKISVSERDFSQILVELIDDIRDTVDQNDESNESQLVVLLKCLFVMKSALELIRSPLEDNVHLNSLLHALVVPAMENGEAAVRERGIHCLGLCSFLSKDLAAKNLDIFVQCFAQGHESLKLDAIRIISDLLIIHGLDVVNEDSLMTIYKLYYKAVRNTRLPELQALAAEAVCKLLLQGVFTEEDVSLMWDTNNKKTKKRAYIY
ncbi:Ycg1p [Sugiyamaella lignohabitans]|uniref:Ycg1p n=1 Tax=Sugiyamaella lignohabitans TaxID=796027 RepID=A0A167FC97_9ASCO|nr:Ycg1p [Sugiyamaella lignohabitans]ANB15108.1 Ycg1p [Sugiyamaella lignohabitans]